MVVSNGPVISRGFVYTVAAANASYFVGEGVPSPGSPRFKVNANTDLFGAPNKVTVLLTTEAAPAEREKAYSIDWACLTSIGGCKDRYKVFPLMAEITKNGVGRGSTLNEMRSFRAPHPSGDPVRLSKNDYGFALSPDSSKLAIPQPSTHPINLLS
jgi:hypothetical protein